MSRRLYISLCSIFFAISCQKEPQPFRIKVAGHDIHFPTTSQILRRQHPNIISSQNIFLEDTTQHSRAVWKFKNSSESLGSEPYGVLVSFFGKGQRMDSVQKFFEKQFDQVFKRQTTANRLDKYEYYEPDSSPRIMQVNDDVQLSLSRRNVWPVGLDALTENVIVSICYGLTAEEQERFAFKQEIRKRD